MTELKQATDTTRLLFMTSSTDHLTGATGLTLTLTLSKAGGAFLSITPTVAERSNGWYAVSLTTAHTDTLGDLAIHAEATGADPTDRLFNVVANLEADTYALVGTVPGNVWEEISDNHLTPGTTGYELAQAANAGGGSTSVATFRFSTTTTMADPGSGNMRFNAGTLAATTQVAFDQISEGGTDVTNGIMGVLPGDRLNWQSQADASISGSFTVTAVPINETGWFRVSVSHDQGSTLPANNAILLVRFVRPAVTTDSWSTLLPGSYTAGMAGKIVGDFLNVAVSSRSSHTPADVWAAASRTLTAAGLDAVVVEAGLNARQALAIIASSASGVLAGAASPNVTIAAAGVPATTRITATVDSSGNRSSVTLSPPA